MQWESNMLRNYRSVSRALRNSQICPIQILIYGYITPQQLLLKHFLSYNKRLKGDTDDLNVSVPSCFVVLRKITLSDGNETPLQLRSQLIGFPVFPLLQLPFLLNSSSRLRISTRSRLSMNFSRPSLLRLVNELWFCLLLFLFLFFSLQARQRQRQARSN